MYTIKELAQLDTINKMIITYSDELQHAYEDWQTGRITEDEFNTLYSIIQLKAETLWLNPEQGGSRFPVWFEDLYVPDNMKDMFNETFGDCYMQLG